MKQMKIRHGRTIGFLFLAAFAAYGFGNMLFEWEEKVYSFFGGMLIATNSLIVIAIGLLMRRALVRHNALVADAYFFTRFMEGVLLGTGLLQGVTGHAPSLAEGYIFAMLLLGIGSVPMCYVLYRKHLAPAWLAIWGMAGYILLAIGFFMDAFGYSISMYMLVPGGLWEVAFALCLILVPAKIQKKTHQL